MFKSISIKTKLILIIMVPLLSSLFFGGVLIKESSETKSQMQRIQALVELSSKMSALVHESQKERGMTAGYIGSKGQKFVDKLPQQQALFNEKRNDLLKALSVFDRSNFDQNLADKVDAALEHLEKTSAVRKQIKALDIPLGKALGHYTRINSMMLSNIEYLAHLSQDPTITSDIIAFANFLQSKERAGIERAVLTNTFARNNFAPGFYKKFISLVTEQNAYMRVFEANAQGTHIEFMQKAMKDPSVAEVQRMRDVANKHMASGQFGIEPGYWFATITKKINQLKSVEDFLTTELILRTQQFSNASSKAFYMSIGLIVVSMILLFVLAIWVMRGINISINRLQLGMNSVIKTGDFSKKVESYANDELGVITKDFNEFLMQLGHVIDEVNRVLMNVAKGQYGDQVDFDGAGDLKTLKEGVNLSSHSVEFMMVELEKVMVAMESGQFDYQMSDKVPADFRQKVHHALGSVDEVLVQVNTVMNALNQGNFDQRIDIDAKGVLATLKNGLNHSMSQLAGAISEISLVIKAQSEGDLSQKVHSDFQGELGHLKESINASNLALSEIVTVALNTSNNVHFSAEEVASSAQNLSQRVQQQAASLRESSVTLESFKEAVISNAKLAADESKIEEEVESKAMKASEIMEQTIDAMNQIQESSQKISDIVNLIEGIAFQTNLLALNAAVEAARAGEHGRGFAVVAGEVRALAQKSSEAAKDITALITESVDRINKGTELASVSGDAIREITQLIEQVARMSAQISTATNEQADDVHQLQQSVSQIDQVTQQNTALVEQASSTSESMQHQAADLKQRLAIFKV
jgi:methyl-accepting chemotaxis protein